MNTRLHFTSRDLESLPEDGRPYEIIDGELRVSRQSHWHCQCICLQFGEAPQAWSRMTGAGVTNLAPDVIAAEDDDVAPDVVWMSQARHATVVDDEGKARAVLDRVDRGVVAGWSQRAAGRDSRARSTRAGAFTSPGSWGGGNGRLRSTSAPRGRANVPGFACPVDDL